MHPLVVFLHGQRGVGEGGLCPQDIAHDYQRWGTLLDLPARCGVVVVAVNISDTGFSPDGAAADAVEALAWARTSWPGRDSLREPPVAVDPSRPRRAQEWRPSGTPGSEGGGSAGGAG